MTTTHPLGVQLYSVRDDLGKGHREGAEYETLARTLERLAGFGFTHVEPYDILGYTDALGRAMRSAGLQATAAHARITDDTADAVFAAAGALGISTLIVPWVEPTSIADLDGVERLADAVNRASARAASHGLRVGYHNHDFEFAQHIDGVSAYERLVALLDPSVILEVDTYWAATGGADVFELLPRLADRVRFLHVTNEPPAADDPPIQGVDITGRLAQIVQLSTSFVEMPVVEVVVDDGDVFPLLERNARFFLEQVNV